MGIGDWGLGIGDWRKRGGGIVPASSIRTEDGGPKTGAPARRACSAWSTGSLRDCRGLGFVDEHE